MARLGMLIETEKCFGCDICLKTCKDEFIGNDYPPLSASQPGTTYGFGMSNQFGWPETPSTSTVWVSHGHNWMDVQEETSGKFPKIKVRFIPQPCMQCDDAPCVKAATGGAVYKRPDGVVIIDPEKSKRQNQIVDSCPYGRVYWNNANLIPQKCTFCAHLIDQGKQPKCVEACPVTAITFGDLDNPNSEVSKKIKSLNAKTPHPEYGAKPKVYYSGLP